MPDCTGPAVVAVIGGGASGTLTALHLARRAAEARRRVAILLVEPGPTGEGLAYSTRDPRHRLNVPAKGMSAFPDDPEHFLRWMRRHVAVDFPAGGFAPRQYYSDYMTSCLTDALTDNAYAELEQVRARATDVRRHGRRLRISLDDGTSRPVDATVLATGHGAPSAGWAPEALRRSHRFVADPWRASAAPTVKSGDDIVLVGAGLTMADMAQRWGRSGVRLHVVSRHGLMPLPHASEPQPPAAAPQLPDGPLTAAQLRRIVFDRVRACDGDWRRAIDGLRPVTAELWRRMDDAERATFLRTAARRWDRVRHRVDPALDAWLEQRVADGSMIVHTAEVSGARESADGLTVELSDGSSIRAAAVFNCTGTTVALQQDEDPLVLNLLNSGSARPGSLDLGYATDEHGRLESSNGSSPAIYAVGPLRRGQLWESTAIPEIKMQADDVAAQVVATLPEPGLRRRARDPYGLPITASAGAAEVYVGALGRILRVQSGAETLLADALAADPEFALGHAVQALLGVEWGADVDVEAALTEAHRTMHRADERERHFVEVATARVREPGAASAAALLTYINAYPEDALAVSIAVPTIAFGGATEIPAEAWALVEGLTPAYGGDWWHRGLLAFVRQEQERWDEARELADLSLAEEPAAGHAVHARTHVHYETGDHTAGLRWLDGWIRSCGANASHRAHFSWHAALHELALGDDQAALRRYAGQLAPPVVSGVRALVDSASLLWRGYVSGAWGAADTAPVLETVPEHLLVDPPTPFIGLHAAMALAASGDCHRLAALRRSAAARPEPVFSATIAPLADALCDLIHGDPDRATQALLGLEGVEQLGGSAAQREIVQETLILSATRAGRTDIARTILLDRLERRQSPRDARRCAQLTTPH